MSEKEKTRVLVVDDSPLMCRVIKDILNSDEEIEVTGEARSGVDALKALASGSYDICTLDVHMPGMSGLTALKHIMIKFPLPVLMVSAFTSEGARTTFDALRYGAVDFFHKPSRDKGEDMMEQARRLCLKVRKVARVQVSAARYLRLKHASGHLSGKTSTPVWNEKEIVVVRASTGGYSALISLLPMLKPAPSVPVVVSFGIQKAHLEAFSNYIRNFLVANIVIPSGNIVLEPGNIYLLADDETAAFDKSGEKWMMQVGKRTEFTDMEGPVDLILFGASEHFSDGTLFVSLSGDGVQGISGARELIRNGGRVIVQKPETCLAPSMSRRLIKELNCEVCTISEIVAKILTWGDSSKV
jgi:two-component system chemotaxis response regulator CheB